MQRHPQPAASLFICTALLPLVELHMLAALARALNCVDRMPPLEDLRNHSAGHFGMRVYFTGATMAKFALGGLVISPLR